LITEDVSEQRFEIETRFKYKSITELTVLFVTFIGWSISSTSYVNIQTLITNSTYNRNDSYGNISS